MMLQLKTQEEFQAAKKKYSSKSAVSWEDYMWDFYKEETYYDTDNDFFIAKKIFKGTSKIS